MNPAPPTFQHAELFISPDGKIMGHNITPEIAAILSTLNRGDTSMLERAQCASGVSPEERRRSFQRNAQIQFKAEEAKRSNNSTET